MSQQRLTTKKPTTPVSNEPQPTTPSPSTITSTSSPKGTDLTSKTQPVAIEVRNLSKSFRLGFEPAAGTLKERLLTGRKSKANTPKPETDDNFQALSNIDFTVMQGETFGILGHNGSGKSTLLKIIAGTMRPDEGRVRVRGRLAALLELGAGFHPDLTGRENVYLNGSILGFPREYVDSIFDDILDFSEIGDFIDLQVRYYSSGMAARLGFSVATNLNPDVLLIDEVLAVGDEAFQLKCMERVHRFRSLGRTMLIVSHGPERMRDLCNRLLVLQRGKLLHVGDVEEGIEIYRSTLHKAAKEKANPTKTSNQPRENKASENSETSSDGEPTQVAIRSGEVVLPSADKAKASVEPGDSVQILVRYEVLDPTPFRIRLTVHTRDNSLMISRSTTDIPLCPPLAKSGKGELLFMLHDIPLLDGRYHISAVAESLDGDRLLHRLPNVGEIAVSGPGARYGRVNARVSCSDPDVTDLT